MTRDELIKMASATAYSEPTSALHCQIAKNALTQAVEMSGISPVGARVLDIGSGSGVCLDTLFQLGFSKNLMVGNNIVPEDIKAVRDKGYECVEADMHDLTGAMFPKKFNLVVARHILEHSVMPMLVLQNVREMLVPGGVFYMEVPAPDTCALHDINNENHMSVLGYRAWKALLLRSGFELIDTFRMKFEILYGEDEYYGFICRSN